MKRVFLLAAVAALALTACTVYVTPSDVSVTGRLRFGIGVSDVIQVFEPSRGPGSSYRVGETIAFRVLTNQDGYLTLSAIDPDGAVYTFARNLRVRGGRVQVFEGPDAGSVFSLVPPRGLHRVRAVFTSAPTSGLVSYRGVVGETVWTARIRSEVSDHQVRDIAETSFYLD